MKITELTPDEANGIAGYRVWLNEILTRKFGSHDILCGTDADVPLIDLLVQNGPYTEDAAGELTVLGSALGEVIANRLGMKWVVFQDEHGSSFALKHEKHEVFTFPQDMLVKRAERRELASVVDLFQEVIHCLTTEIHAHDTINKEEAYKTLHPTAGNVLL